MAKINCDYGDCKFQKDGVCTAEEVTIEEESWEGMGIEEIPVCNTWRENG